MEQIDLFPLNATKTCFLGTLSREQKLFLYVNRINILSKCKTYKTSQNVHRKTTHYIFHH